MQKIFEINRIDKFFELKHEWNEVLNKSRDNNIFLTWEYLSTYWTHFGKDKKLKILYITNNNEIIAIAPLRQSRYGYSGPLGYDVIEPLGYRGLMPEGADYTGLIFTEREAYCLELFLHYLVEHDSWRFIYMYDIPETSIITDLLPNLSKDTPRFDINKGVACPYISIPNSIEIFMKELNSNFRKNLRRSKRNLEKDHPKVELKKYDEFGSVEEAMKIFFNLHQERWTSKDMLGVFNTQKVRDFYINIAKLFAEKGWLALYFLTVSGEPIATQYCYEYQKKMYYILGGFDPIYSSYSVGHLMLLKIIEKCIEKKIGEYDLLKGGESYKFRYTTTYRTNVGIKFINRNTTSNIYNWGIQTVKQMNKILGRM